MQIALYEAKNKLSGLVDEVLRGGEVTITRRGKAVARLMPVEGGFDRAKAEQAAKRLLELRENFTLGGLSVKELKNEGRP